MSKLTKRFIESDLEPGRYNDGNGLYLVVTPRGSKQWILRTRIRGKQTDLGLGGLSYTPLPDARRKAYELRAVARNGGDPRIQNKKKIPTFAELAQSVHEERLPTWKNPKHAQQWINTLETYAYPEIGNSGVDMIDTSDVLKIISPLWTSKHETARRVMQRIGVVFDVAKARKYRAGENPIQEIKALNVLPKVKKSGNHHAAMDWRELPAFYETLKTMDSNGALALRFLILTAARTSEVIGATWDEIDFDARLWTIPAERMKASKPHVVPLCHEAITILESVQGVSDQIVFQGQKRHKPMSNMAMEAVLRRMDRKDVTVHGFRSTFRDWGTDAAKAPREVLEASLAHNTMSKTEAAYARSNLLNRRKPLMERWGQYATGGIADVVKIHG